MGEPRIHWRLAFRRELTLLLAVKFGALALLWWLWFSPAHRQAVDAQATSRQLAVAATTDAPASARDDDTQSPTRSAQDRR